MKTRSNIRWTRMETVPEGYEAGWTGTSKSGLPVRVLRPAAQYEMQYLADTGWKPVPERLRRYELDGTE